MGWISTHKAPTTLFVFVCSHTATDRLIILEPTTRGFILISSASLPSSLVADLPLPRAMHLHIFFSLLLRLSVLFVPSPPINSAAYSLSLALQPDMSTPNFRLLGSVHTMPMFDKAKPCELLTFFNALEHLSDCLAVTSEIHKKQHILYYVDHNAMQCWKCLPEYFNPAMSYRVFKDAILYLYPKTFSFRDLNLLIRNTQQAVISNTSQLYNYHLQFSAITSQLIKEQRLSSLERDWSYIRAFCPSLLSTISQYLQTKHPEHIPQVLYPVSDIYDAAFVVLQKALWCAPPVALAALDHELDTPISLTQDQIKAFSPEMRSKLKDLIAACYQNTSITLQHVHTNLECQHNPQRPSATPLVTTTHRSQHATAQCIAHLVKVTSSASSHLEPNYQSPRVSQVPATAQIQKSELDTLITITHD